MKIKASILSKMADAILKGSDRAEALAKSKQNQQRIQALHEAMTDKYKFYMTIGYSTDSTRKDIDFLKSVEKKLTLNDKEQSKLSDLFFKYKIS